MKAFVFDAGKCNGCYSCQIACKDEHSDNDWTPYAKPQPEIGHFWIKLNETVRGTVPKVKVSYKVVMCLHCDNAPCMTVCPVKGAIYKRHDGLVVINPQKCDGCKKCIEACPENAIYFNDEYNIAQKCTGCAHLLDRGWKEPRCTDICPTQAIMFGEEQELAEIIKKAGDRENSAIRPRVHYLNLPKRFIAGTVFDPDEEEVIIGAECILTVQPGREKARTKTDSFGDFWFEGLERAVYDLRIEYLGKIKEYTGINTEKDINLGDIPF